MSGATGQGPPHSGRRTGPLAGRVAVVSGGGRGLGRSFCLALARQGAKVVVNNRNRVMDADGRGPADHVAAEIMAAGGEAVAEYSDAADPAAGRRWSRRRWSAGDGWTSAWPTRRSASGGMFHKQPAAQFGEVLEINLHGSVRLARAAMAVMRPAGYGRIILVASTGGLHGDVGLSAYAASKGGLLAFGRSLAAEGAGRGVLTNMLLPYALTQMTDAGMPPAAGSSMEPDAVAPVLTALASEECRLNGEYIVTGGGRLRRASVVEWGTVLLPNGPGLSPDQLRSPAGTSGRGEPREFRVSVDAFNDLMDPGAVPGELGAAAGEPGGHGRGGGGADAGDLLLRDAHPGARDHGHDLAARVRAHRGGVVRAVGRGTARRDGGCWCWCSPRSGGCGSARTSISRNCGQGEDKRYASLLRRNPGAWPRSCCATSTGRRAGSCGSCRCRCRSAMYEHARAGPVTWLGVAVWAVGFGFEAVGMRSCAGSGRIRLTRGGCSIAACGATPGTRTTSATPWCGSACGCWPARTGSGWCWWPAPVYMTNMLVRHTGKKLLEKHMARSKGAAYADYVGAPAASVPRPPRKPGPMLPAPR